MTFVCPAPAALVSYPRKKFDNDREVLFCAIQRSCGMKKAVTRFIHFKRRSKGFVPRAARRLAWSGVGKRTVRATASAATAASEAASRNLLDCNFPFTAGPISLFSVQTQVMQVAVPHLKT